MELTGKTFGEVIAQETLAQTPVVQVLRGTESASRLPVLIFVFDRDLESVAAQKWAQSRALRSRAPVLQIAIIDAQQTAELFFVSVAWNPQSTTNMGTLPPRLIQILAWLQSSSRDELGVRVTDVLRALENLEPRAVARTMMLEPNSENAPPLKSDSLRSTSILPAQNSPRRTTTLTASPVELSAVIEPEYAVPSSRRLLFWGAGVGIAAAAIIGFSVHSANLVRPPSAAQQPGAPPEAPPQAPAPQVPAPVNAMPSQPLAEPIEAPAEVEPPTVQTVVVTSRPAGATVCDPKTGKILGKTPLNLPKRKFAVGHKLLLTRVGSQFRSFRWPADHTMTLSRLDTDETQPLSPCAF